MRGFLEGNASPLTEHPVPPVDALNAAGYGFYASGIMEKLAATPYDEMIAGDIVWVGTPEDVVQRIARDDRGLRGPDRDRDHRRTPAASSTGRRSRRRSSSRSTSSRVFADGVTRIVVAGAGSIGSLLAAHLARVAEVTVLTRREEHAQALEADGLRVSGRADFTAPLHATADPAELPEDAGLAILACKGTDLEPLAARLEGRLSGATAMTIQNGLGAEEVLAAHGEWPILSAVTFMSGTRHGDAHVEYVLDTATWVGPYRGTTEADARRVAELLEAAGLKAQAFADLRPAQWSKLVFNATVNGVAALTTLPHDFHFAQTDEPWDLGHLVHDLVDEGKSVAAAAGIVLHDDPWEMNVLATQRGHRHYPSMLEDVEARRPTELESINGALVREARRLGVPAPLQTALYRLVKAREASYSE